jgi:tetratricopeptide (TPR) repeat protein
MQAALFATNSGKRLRSAGDLDGAISQFRSAINSSQDFAPAHYELGLALLLKGKREEAANEFEKAKLLDPKLVPPAN